MSNNTQPEIRFPGFMEDWEERKLNELAEFNPKSDLPERFEYVDLESVVGTELVRHRTENRYSAPSRAQRLAKKMMCFIRQCALIKRIIISLTYLMITMFSQQVMHK